MTISGWVQIALYCAILVAVTKPLGGYMTRVFDGERTFLSFALRPVERGIYRVCGVNGAEEQHWVAYAIAMLAFSFAGFVTMYGLQRVQGLLPFNPQGEGAISPDLAFDTSISFVTNTNWQSYTPETTMSYLTQMAGLAVHNFVSAATGIALAMALIAVLPAVRPRLSAISGSISLVAFFTSCSPHRLSSRCSSSGRVCRRIYSHTWRQRLWKAASSSLRRGRSRPRKRSRCWARTVVASSMPTLPTCMRTPLLSPTSCRCF